MTVYALGDDVPSLGADVWVAESAEVIGHVELGDEASVWFGAVVRGDHREPIRIGARTNVQDGSVLHADPGKPLTLGDDVTVGHRVVLHGCTIGDGSLIGMGAVVLNNARIGQHCLVGAGAVITEGKSFPDGTLIVGSPAVVKRTLSPEEVQGLKVLAGRYVANARRFREGLRPLNLD